MVTIAALFATVTTLRGYLSNIREIFLKLYPGRADPFVGSHTKQGSTTWKQEPPLFD